VLEFLNQGQVPIAVWVAPRILASGTAGVAPGWVVECAVGLVEDARWSGFTSGRVTISIWSAAWTTRRGCRRQPVGLGGWSAVVVGSGSSRWVGLVEASDLRC